MRKIGAILFCISSLNTLAQTLKPDTIRNIELPVAVIKETKTNLLNEKNTRRLEKKLLNRINQGQDIPFLLNSLSSVVASSDAGTGTGYSNIRIRGTDLTRINVTLNGVPVNDPESQATYFVNTPDVLSSAQEVEISKGVGISKNGVGNFGAGIAINNLDVQQVSPYLSYSIDFGTFNTLKNTLKASTGLIENKFIGTIRVSSIASDGYIERASAKLKALQFSGKYIISPNMQVVLNYMKGHEKTGQAWNGVPEDSLKSNRRYNELGLRSDGTFYGNQSDNYGQDYYQLLFDKKINTSLSIGSTLFYTKGKGYYEEFKTNQTFADYYLPNFILGSVTFSNTDLIRQLWLNNDFYGGRFYINYLSKKLDAGLFFNLNHYEGKHYGDIKWAQYGIADDYRWYNLTASKSDFNVYGMAEYRLSPLWSIFADIQYRNVNYVLNGFRKNPNIVHNLKYQFLNPKMKITFKKDKHMVSLLAGMTQKEPNRDDIEVGINTLPSPEKLYNTELNYIFSLKNNLGIYATSYLMYYQDQLVLTGKINDVGAYTRTNIPKSYRIGMELEVLWKPNPKLIEIACNMALSQNKIIQFIEYIDDYDQGLQKINSYQKTDIAFSPALIAGGRISYFPLKVLNHSLFHKLSMDILPKYVSRQYLDNTQQISRSLNPYFTTDALINLPLLLYSKTTLNLKTGIYNLFNTMYESNGYTYSYIYNQSLTTQNYYFPQAGRRWMFGLTLEIQ